MCRCKENHWVRNAGLEIGVGKLPLSDHHPHCPAFKLEEFARVTFDGMSCVVEKADVGLIMGGDHGYTATPVFMTRDQFENLAEFEGY